MKKELEFIKVLRAVAAIIVVFFHWGILFFAQNQVASSISFSKPQQFESVPFWVGIIVRLKYLDLGMVGVCIFFLITGFLAPLSIERVKCARNYILNRIVRLYPIYSICLAFTCIELLVSAKINGISFPYGIKDYLYNLSLFRNWFCKPTIDNVSWTMEYQVFFYLICAIIMFLFKMNICDERIIACILAGGTLSVFINSRLMEVVLGVNSELYWFLYTLDQSFLFAMIMIIGTCFSNIYLGKWGKKRFLFYLFGSFIALWVNFGAIFLENKNIWIVSYGLGIMIFTLGFYARKCLQNHSFKLLGKISEISFPLYLTHGVGGYALLSLLTNNMKVNIYLALFITSIVFFFIAGLAHFLIEIPIKNKLMYILSKE